MGAEGMGGISTGSRCRMLGATPDKTVKKKYAHVVGRDSWSVRACVDEASASRATRRSPLHPCGAVGRDGGGDDRTTVTQGARLTCIVFVSLWMDAFLRNNINPLVWGVRITIMATDRLCCLR